MSSLSADRCQPPDLNPCGAADTRRSNRHPEARRSTAADNLVARALAGVASGGPATRGIAR